jgi:hypothetical protein
MTLSSVCPEHSLQSSLHCSEVYVWAHTQVSSPCLLHNNTGQYPQPSGCSFPSKQCFWHYLWRLWICLSQTLYSIFFTSFTNGWEPLQPFPWSLANPVHFIVSQGEYRCCTGESHGNPWLHLAFPRLHQLNLTLDTCKHRESWSGNSYTCPFFLSLMFTHTLHSSYAP